MRTGQKARWAEGVLLGLGASLVMAVAAYASGGGEHGGVDSAKISDLIWRSVNFLVFAAILVKLVAKPAKQFFQSRSQEISESLEDLEAKKAAAAQALREAEARLDAVAAERDKLIAQFIAEGETEKAKILQKADMVAERIKAMAALTIEQETKKAAQGLKQEVAAQATQLAEKLLKEKITFADHQKLVEEYLQKVVKH